MLIRKKDHFSAKIHSSTQTSAMHRTLQHHSAAQSCKRHLLVVFIRLVGILPSSCIKVLSNFLSSQVKGRQMGKQKAKSAQKFAYFVICSFHEICIEPRFSSGQGLRQSSRDWAVEEMEAPTRQVWQRRKIIIASAITVGWMKLLNSTFAHNSYFPWKCYWKMPRPLSCTHIRAHDSMLSWCNGK